MAFTETPASIGQRLLWFLEHYRPDATSLNCPVVCRLHGPLQPADLGYAINRVVDRHEALRTTLHRQRRQLVQRIHDSADVPLAVRHLDDQRGGRAAEALLQGQLEVELRTPVDAGTAPLRATLWRLAPDEHVLCLNMHHLVSDAWSCGVVIQDLLRFMDAGPDGDPGLPPVRWQYRDFTRWQEEQVGIGALAAHQRYWLDQLRGMRLVPLPKADAGGTRRMALTTADVDAGTFAALRALAAAERTTIFAVMLSVYYLLLHQRTGQTDMSLASLFANRSRRELQSTVGFFANMVVLRSTVDPDESFVDLVRRVRRTVVDAFLHECVPYQMLPVANQNPGRRIDDLVFQMLITPPPGSKSSARGVDFELYTPDTLGSRFGLELGLVPQHDGSCRAMFFFTEELMSLPEARRALDDYVELARQVSRHPDGKPVRT